MDNSVSSGEGARARESEPLIKMNGILEPGKRMVGLCKDLITLHHVFVLLFLWKHRAPEFTGNLCCARLCVLVRACREADYLLCIHLSDW